MKKLLLFAAAVLILNGCVASGYQKFYKSYIDINAIPDIETLQPGEEPQVFGTNDFERDINILRSKRYIVIGFSSFNGGYEDIKNAVAQAKRIGATLILTKSEYTNTQTTNSALFLPNTQTTYHSGNVYSGSAYGSYSGTSTSYGSTIVPYTTNQRRFDQAAAFLVKSNQKVKFGVSINDLTPELRSELERNTGALIELVIEDTPAFYANVMAGDILTSIDNVAVKNAEHASQLLKAVDASAEFSYLKVIRKGEEKEIKISFK